MKNKEQFLAILEKNFPNINKACQEFGINRKTYHEWYNKFPEFRTEVDSMRETLIDITENVLFNAIKEGDIKAAMFALKYLGKKRGYTDSMDITSDGKPISINLNWVKNKNDIKEDGE